MGQSERTGLPILLTRLVVLPTTVITDGTESGRRQFRKPIRSAPDDLQMMMHKLSADPASSATGCAYINGSA